MYNFNGKSNRRFVEANKVRGVIVSSKSFECIVHIPTEYDYHYIVSEHMSGMIYYIYLSKQLNSITPAELYVVKTDVEFLASYAVKEKQKSEEEFKRLEGLKYSKDLFKSKFTFEIFKPAFKQSFLSATEAVNYFLQNKLEGYSNEFNMKDIEPLSVLSASKVGRVILVQNKTTKNKYAVKYMYKWKLVKFNEEERFLEILYKLPRTKDIDNIAKYYSVQYIPTLVLFYMPFYMYVRFAHCLVVVACYSI